MSILNGHVLNTSYRDILFYFREKRLQFNARFNVTIPAVYDDIVAIASFQYYECFICFI